MEILHAMRFFTKLRMMDPTITMDGWSDIYRHLQDNPGWSCGCPNQVLDPRRERWLKWFHEQVAEEGLEEDSG